MFRRILVATDLLPSSMPALRAGLRLADGFRARLAVVYVLEMWMIDRQWFSDVTQEDIAAHRALMQREEEAAVREMQKQIRQACAAERIEAEAAPVVRDGKAPHAIVAVATEHDCDLIVVGTRGERGGLGSVAEQVVRIAGRPVLVVPSHPSA